MTLLNCRNGALLIYEHDTETYWLVTEAYGKTIKLFAGDDPAKATKMFKTYTKGE